MRSFKLLLSTTVLLASASTGWAFDWNPFSKKETTKTPMMNGQPLVTRAPANASMGQRLGDGTKKVAQGAVDVVTLKPLREAMSTEKPQAKGANRYPMPQMNKPAAKKPGMFDSLFGSKKPKKTGPQTMNEWIAQPRPKP